ncbi:MAG TPA: Crp/Fnr family transcriptional regulator [Ramlibacter sp.]|uniref:Crp/Fnr family transcriptional regulator n=1 Tax=Ramlibacter sp. TaxID=1917967 RepID=UPI002BF8ADFD|nr:Crp/Fnr family transcriptional regulator [Ramlibacter sp.]HVZ43645.1 Crp/Fnr family transcriptional regulator [Ramlibacter sp.]
MALLSTPFPGMSMLFRDPTRPAVQFLAMQPWFSQLSPELQQTVADAVFTIPGTKGDVLLRAGEEVDGWYAVLTGLVKLQSQFGHRRQGFLGIPGGEWFGEGSAMKKEPRRYDAIALRDTELMCLPRALFDELRETSIPFNHTLTDCLNMRLGQAMAIIETMRLRTPDQRVAMYLGRTLWHGSRRMSLSQEELGIIAGLSRQTVNGVLKDFETKGLVSLEFGRIDIRDEAGLAQLVWGTPNPPGKP